MSLDMQRKVCVCGLSEGDQDITEMCNRGKRHAHRPVTTKHSLHMLCSRAEACWRKADILGCSSTGLWTDKKHP